MATALIPAVGSEYGPCERCSHIDCAAIREMARSICPICEIPMGYGTHYYEENGSPVHAECYEVKVEAEMGR